MTEELERAAATASEALGMDASTIWPHRGGIAIHIKPVGHTSRGLGTEAEVLAYLEGLETGARIQRERHRPLVAAAQAVSRLSFYGGDCDEYHVDADALRALTLALSQLED